MADCTKTVEFLREKSRMCGSCACYECPASAGNNGYDVPCEQLIFGLPEEYMRIVQKWSDEHPVMTWIGKLKEAFPGCDAATMITEACPGWVFGRGPNRINTPCDGKKTRKCGDCWNGEYKEVDSDGV